MEGVNVPTMSPTRNNVVILYKERRTDPRPHQDGIERKREVRVVLRLDGPRARVIVEIEDEEDAVGDVAWYRLCFDRSEDPAKNLADARAAYEVIEDIVATLYERARVIEERLVTSEGRVKQLEQRIAAAQMLKRPAPAQAQVDPLANVKTKVMGLLTLASNEAVGDEERQAVLRNAMDMIAKYNLLKQTSSTPTPQQK